MSAVTTPHIPAREARILALVVEGKTSKEIATALGLSPATVQGYRKSLHHQLGCCNAASLVRTALERNLVARQAG